MKQYHIYKNLNQKSKGLYPYLIDVQTALLSNLETRITIPLTLKERIEKAIVKNLNPVLVINKKEYVLLTQQMASIPKSQFGPLVCNCMSYRNEILSAIDFLITGI